MLAIIIPFYKLTFFEATLQSLAHQSDKRFKVYIGDDASPEDCSALLQKFEGQFDFIYHRFETNIGGTSLTQQWERCIALSDDEEWLMILGDDDVLGENVVEEFYKQYDVFKDMSNLLRFSTQLIDSRRQKLFGVFNHPEFESGIDFLYRKITGQTRSSLSEYIFRKKVFDRHIFKNYPLAWHSDDKAWVDFAEEKSIYSINNSLVNIRYSAQSISGSQDNLDLKNRASVQFYRDIINEYFHQFNKVQKLYVLRKYEGLLKDKRLLKERELFLFILKYIQIKDGKMLFDFIKRFVQYKIGRR